VVPIIAVARDDNESGVRDPFHRFEDPLREETFGSRR
jgi:hypothetical protein